MVAALAFVASGCAAAAQTAPPAGESAAPIVQVLPNGLTLIV